MWHSIRAIPCLNNRASSAITGPQASLDPPWRTEFDTDSDFAPGQYQEKTRKPLTDGERPAFSIVECNSCALWGCPWLRGAHGSGFFACVKAPQPAFLRTGAINIFVYLQLLPSFLIPAPSLLSPTVALISHLTPSMATPVRAGSSLLRTSLRSSSTTPFRAASYNALRCYSAGKSQVCSIPYVTLYRLLSIIYSLSKTHLQRSYPAKSRRSKS